MTDFLSYEFGGEIGLENGHSIFVLESAVFGTAVENANSTTSVPTNNEICARSGFRARVGKLIQEEYTKEWVLPKFSEQIHPQLLVRSVVDRSSVGAVNPDDTNREAFLSTSVAPEDF